MSVIGEIIQNIGRTLITAADDQNPSWEYVGYTFNTSDGVNYEGSGFLFVGEVLQEFTLRQIGKELGKLHLHLREIMLQDNQPGWLASRCVIRNLDREIVHHFEFDNPARWRISPRNVDIPFVVLVGDAFVAGCSVDGPTESFKCKGEALENTRLRGSSLNIKYIKEMKS